MITMIHSNALAFPTLLREKGFKATNARLALLDVLKKANRPLSTPEIVKRLEAYSDQSTVYRGLDSLSEIGMIRRVEMGHTHAHYELAIGGLHHHHIICKACHQTEDISDCTMETREQSILGHSQRFARIESHALEFFGICNHCATQK